MSQPEDPTNIPASFHTSPTEALQAPPEELLYAACLHEGTGVAAPDFLAVLDAKTGEIVHETPMPNVGDELHHFGWNRCSSACHGPDRSHLIVPGFRSSRIHIVNVEDDPRRPRIEKVIEPEELVGETGYTRPHTVHCMPGDNVVVSMLGDADGGGAGGFAVLDARTFELKGRWEDGGETSVTNCCLLCDYHHRRVHHDGWDVELINGVIHVIPPPWIDPDRVPRPNQHPDRLIDLRRIPRPPGYSRE